MLRLRGLQVSRRKTEDQSEEQQRLWLGCLATVVVVCRVYGQLSHRGSVVHRTVAPICQTHLARLYIATASYPLLLCAPVDPDERYPGVHLASCFVLFVGCILVCIAMYFDLFLADASVDGT